MSVEIVRSEYASPGWRADIIGTPAMVMAYGICIVYPCQYILAFLFGDALREAIVLVLSGMLSLFALFVMFRFARQFARNRSVLWAHTIDHLRIGTWIAGLNVMSAVLAGIDIWVARFLHAAGCALWLLFVVWLVKMTIRKEFRNRDLNGSVFLSTVATQSVAIGFVRAWPDLVPEYIHLLISVNVIGIVFYWIAFGLVWVAGGLLGPIRDWAVQNHITHGALSISMLVAQMIEEAIPGTLPYFHFVIQVAWGTATLLVAAMMAYEISLIALRKKDLLAFNMKNYARNFTLGMYFACTFYGYSYSHPSIMKSLLTPEVLLAIAFVVATVNVWELGHQVYLLAFPSLRVGSNQVIPENLR